MAVQILTCTRCGYEWAQKFLKKPKYCTKCKSPYWSRDRVFDKKTGKKIIQK